MTVVEIAIQGAEFSLVAKGHSGFADMGNDIVCAAISTLLQTLLKHLDDKGYWLEFHIEPGDFWLHSKGWNVIEYLELTICGLDMIAAEYPQHLEVHKGCTIIDDHPCV